MKRILNTSLAFLVCLILSQTKAFGSSHREAPLISNDPLADNTDVYAFKSPTDPNKIILIANYIPFEHPAGGPNWYTFGQDIRYEIHIENNGDRGDDIVYRFTFTRNDEDPSTFFRIRLGKENLKNTYKLERSMNGGAFETIVDGGVVPPPNIGPRSIESPVGLGASSYENLWLSRITTATTGERVFAGPIEDPFFVDVGGIFDIANIRQGANARDGLAKFNCHSLVLEVPITTLQKSGKSLAEATSILDPDFVIGVWASASRRRLTTFNYQTGTETGSSDWIQVSRLGMPLTNEVIIPFGRKNEWNFTTPSNDDKFEPYLVNPEVALYMDDSKFGGAVPGFADLRIQSHSLGKFDFRNLRTGLFPLKGTPAVAGTALDDAHFGNFLLRRGGPRSLDILPIFHTGVPNLPPYQLALGKNGNPLAPGKPFINNFLPTFGDMLRLNMAVPVTPRNSPDFSSEGLIAACALGLLDPRFNQNTNLQFIPNMDGFPNGRRLEDDVTRIELQAVSGIVLAVLGFWYDDFTPGTTPSPVTPQLLKVVNFTAGPTHDDTTLRASFPFVQVPWRGYNGPSIPCDAQNAPLPVRYTTFEAVKKGQSVLLQWVVTNATDNDHFEIEYSTGGQFSKIGTVAAADRNLFEFQHATPSMDKLNSYRIKQVDHDGRATYSVIRSVKFFGGSLFSVSPNPASTSIRVKTEGNNLTIHLLDQSGKLVQSKRLFDNATDINISTLAKGVYTIILERDGQQLETKKFVKQ
jgi:hypothetical protein